MIDQEGTAREAGSAPPAGSAERGMVQLLGFDDKGYERRLRLSAIGECPRCGEDVELWEDTVQWHKGPDGRWVHDEYSGCAMGECCGLLFADDWDGCRTFEIEPNAEGQHRLTPEKEHD